MQEKFNKASYIYLECQNRINDMVKFKVGKNEVKKDELLKEFDYLLQIILFNVGIVDNNLTKKKLLFIDLLTTDGDILEEYNRKLSKEYTWEGLGNTNLEVDVLNNFINDATMLFIDKINNLIMFLATNDAFRGDNDYLFFKEKIEEILKIYTNFDSVETEKEKAFIKYIIDKMFLEKYLDLKEVFETISKNERLN